MADGETLVHDYVIACCGLLYHPTYPDIDGLDSFTGEAFHSARWNHGVDLTDKKVGLDRKRINGGADYFQFGQRQY